MYPEARTFWMDPSGQSARGARRYCGVSDEFPCIGGRSIHDAVNWIDRVPTETKQDLDSTRFRKDVPALDTELASDWPVACENCGYVFSAYDALQTIGREIFVNHATGEEYVLPVYASSAPPGTTKAPPGAMYHAYWLPSPWRGPDGVALTVVLPNSSQWNIDSRASNCTMPEDREHKCWVRHGDPRTGEVTVDKNGNTCQAGAGSILVGDYHGFLTNGVLTAG